MTDSLSLSELELSDSINISVSKSIQNKKINKPVEDDNESSSGYADFEEKVFEYSSNNQTVELSERIKSSLPLQIKKLDLDLEWECTPNKLPNGIQLNEHNGTISGRLDENANIGTFNYAITAEKHECKWTAKYSINIIQAKIKRFQYPNGNILILNKDEKIKSSIKPVIEGTFPHSFQIMSCLPYEGNMSEGINFDSKTGNFSGCPTVIGKTSWKITAINNRGSFESNIVVIDVRRSVDEYNKPKQEFLIPDKVFKPVDLQVAFDTFKANNSGKLGIQETACVLRALGKTPTTEEVKRVFDKYSNGNSFVTYDQINEIAKEKFYDVNLNEIKKIFESVDKEKSGKISIQKFRKLMRMGNGVNESVIKDICKTIDKQHENVLNYRDLLDLYSRISFGVRFG